MPPCSVLGRAAFRSPNSYTFPTQKRTSNKSNNFMTSCCASCGIVWSHKAGTLSTLFPIRNAVSAGHPASNVATESPSHPGHVAKLATTASKQLKTTCFFLVGALCLSAGHHLKLTRGPAGIEPPLVLCQQHQSAAIPTEPREHLKQFETT